MTKNKFFALLMILATSGAWASATRILDGQQITNSGATLTLPTTTDTLLGRATTDTLTNKSISGASNTLSSIGDASLSVSYLKADGSRALTGNWAAGAFSGTFNSVVVGSAANTISALSTIVNTGTLTLPTSTDTLVGRATTDTLTNKTISGASNTITNVSLTTGVTGTLPFGNGGTGATSYTNHGVVVAGVSSLGTTAVGASGQALISNGPGNDPTFQAISVSPSLNSSPGTPQNVTAGGGVSLSSISYSNIAFIKGSGGAVTVTATPSITAGSAVGQNLLVMGEDNTNTVTLQDEAGLAGTTLQLNGTWVASKYSTLELMWDGTYWVETSRR